MGKNASGKGQGKGKKVGFGVVFIAACFAAAFILMEFHGEFLMVGIAAAVLLLSSFLFMNALFADKATEGVPKEESTEKETSNNGIDSEFRLKITKHMKETESIQKDMLSIVKQQNTMLQNRIENLEQEIYMLAEKQMMQTKTLIKYNKENARQLAISERETLEHVLLELTKALEDNISQITIQTVSAEVTAATNQPVTEGYGQAVPAAEPEPVLAMEEIPEGELFAVEEFPDDDEYGEPDFMTLLDSMEDMTGEEPMTSTMENMEIPDIPTMENMEIPDIPAMEDMEIPDIPAMEDMEIPDIPAMEDMEIPDIPAMEDMEIPDIPAMEDMEIPDIPAMEDMEIPDIPIPEEVPEIVPEQPKAPAPVASDPNAMMTPEDIAKLLESMGV